MYQINRNVISAKNRHISKINNQIFVSLGFFAAFPIILLIGQNVLLFLLLFLFYTISKKRKLIQFNSVIQIIPVLFALGAIFSVLNILNKDTESVSRAVQVLPNYIYWSFLLFLFVAHRELFIKKYFYISKGIMYGLVVSIVYFFIQFLIPELFFLQKVTPNQFSFMCVCFTPIGIYHLKSINKKKLGYILAFISIIANAYAGRRAGTVLIFAGSLITLNLSNNFFSSTFKLVLVFIFIICMLQLDITKDYMFNNSPRVYDMLYNGDDVSKEDRSVLFRKAMVEKGLSIFEKNMLFGIGLNNFGLDNTAISGNFEGAKFVKNKNLQKSSHNSYILILAEGGLCLIIPFVLILLTPIVIFFIYQKRIPIYLKPVYISVLLMSIHLYYISAIVNVFAWVLLSIVLSISTIVINKKNI